MNVITSRYRGSEKHKNRPAHGAKGTLCPEWTHSTPMGGLKNDPFSHAWLQTEAHRIFESSQPHPDGEQRRYATSRGIAFEAKPSNDGYWHGYPIPWEGVPTDLLDRWLDEGVVTNRDIKRHRKHGKNNMTWALDSDSR
ncbi:hypothetical protein [Comamonas sp. BIGb0124]|uniref:hypothetical protein n=1 Tax=Comamonas sp. BIGb0124 TaxID=2485130 RepID=UPI0011CECCD0|nr:hypothetical protein [Comamonas sp. BIGb0124]